MEPSDDFPAFIEAWLVEHDWSQNQLGYEAKISQSLISRWLHPDPIRRTRPSPEKLEQLSPVVGKSYSDLMVMCGYWPKPPKKDEAPDRREDPPQLQATIEAVREGFHAYKESVAERQFRLDVTRQIWQHPRRPRRPRDEQGPASQGSYEAPDKPKSDYRIHNLVSIT